MRKNVLFLSLIFLSPLFGGAILSAETSAIKSNQTTLKSAAKSKSSSQRRIQSPQSNFSINKSFLKPNAVVTKYNEPWDLAELIPIVRDINRMIPRRFSLANHDIRLSSNRMVIEHQFFDARFRAAEKKSIITLFYSGGLGAQLNTHLEVPLFYSSVLGFSNWERYPAGNYTMTIGQTNSTSDASLYIKAQTKF